MSQDSFGKPPPEWNEPAELGAGNAGDTAAKPGVVRHAAIGVKQQRVEELLAKLPIALPKLPLPVGTE